MNLVESIKLTPVMQFFAWLMAWSRLSVCLLIATVVLSAIGVVLTAHETRQLYAEIQALQGQEDFLDSEYEKLLLEQSAWADYSRVDRVSRNELGMSSPGAEDIVVVSR